ncbi:hypothetical protein H6P81_016951 [Aristolochia fimbriata]|uniref:Uncharacterized protein n=1 Tax=Aristolochia fimbriata TaxID=158543 RepID=A0AAV7DX08_ARIFI|nr:hypothetical protein H6P81_016951 [Aristolochia fimbriata]
MGNSLPPSPLSSRTIIWDNYMAGEVFKRPPLMEYSKFGANPNAIGNGFDLMSSSSSGIGRLETCLNLGSLIKLLLSSSSLRRRRPESMGLGVDELGHPLVQNWAMGTAVVGDIYFTRISN